MSLYLNLYTSIKFYLHFYQSTNKYNINTLNDQIVKHHNQVKLYSYKQKQR